MLEYIGSHRVPCRHDDAQFCQDLLFRRCNIPHLGLFITNLSCSMFKAPRASSSVPETTRSLLFNLQNLLTRMNSSPRIVDDGCRTRSFNELTTRRHLMPGPWKMSVQFPWVLNFGPWSTTASWLLRAAAADSELRPNHPHRGIH